MHGCWEYTGARARGYGVTTGGSVHRAVYQELVGPIPSGLFLDHLCRNRACCNPLHLEPVTHGENIRRGIETAPAFQRNKTVCARGHEYTAANTYVRPDGGRNCRECGMLNARVYRRKAAK